MRSRLVLFAVVAAILFALCGIAHAQNTVSVSITGSTSGAPGTVVSLPVTVALNPSVSITGLSFGVTVTASVGAPPGAPSSASLTFTHSTPVAPGINDFAGGVRSVAWVGSLSPALSGIVQVGTVSWTVPATAQNGDVYTLKVNNPTGSYSIPNPTPPPDNIDVEVALSAGANQTYTVVVTPGSLTIVSGNSPTQSGTVNTALANPFVVKVTNAANGTGNPVANVPVTFTVTGGGGTLSAPSAPTTDANGQASVTLTLGTTAGTNTVTAQVTGLPIVTFTANATAGAAAQLSIVSGNGQNAYAGTAVADPLLVKATDQYNNPVSGVTVTFAVASGGGTLTTSSAISDASGQAQATGWTLGSGIGPNNNTVTATITTGGGPVTQTFTASGTVPPAGSIAKVSGDAQSGTVGQALANALVAVVKSAANVPVPGVTVTFTVTPSGAATPSGTTAVTDANGEASVTVTLGQVARQFTVTASVAGVTPSAVFTATALADAPATLTKTGGDNQNGPSGTALASPLVVKVADQFDNPISGAAVVFGITVGGGALNPANGQVTTGSDGKAQVTWTLGSLIGANTVFVTSGSLTPVTFTATVNPASDSQVTALTGTPQSATVGAAFANPLVVKVSTAGGAGVIGAVVNFAVVPGGAATLSAPSATTDASGQAQVTAVAGHTARAFTVTASVTGVTQTATFNLTATADVPALIEKISGDGQNAAAGAALANPLVVKVSDQYSNPVSGAAVTFAITAGGGSLTPANGQVNTGSDGKAQVAWTVGTTIGANTLNAGVGALTPVSFSATANPPSNASVTASSGTPQTGTVGQSPANPLVVLVKTAGGQAIQGAIVNFVVAPTGGGTLSAPSATTDANGLASVTLTLGHTAQLVTVTGSVAGVTQTAAFSVTAAADVPAQIEKISGDGQNAAAGTALPNPVVVKVSDQYSNPVSGAAVTFAITAGGGSLSPVGGVVNTGSDGKAQVAWTVGTTIGAQGLNAVVGAVGPVTFSATANPPSNASVTAFSGTPQTGTVGQSPANPLVVLVKTAGGQAIQGAIVNFVVAPSGGGTLSAPSATTDGNGQASVTLTLGHTAQLVTVTGSVAGVTQTAAFSITAVADVPSQIEKISGDGQNAAAGTALPNPVVVKVSDQYSNPVSGAAVTFAITAGGGSLTPANGQVNTGSDGRAQIAWTVGTTIGAQGLNAVVGAVGPVTFSATANPPSNASVTAFSGTPQTGTVGQSPANPLVVLVKTAGGQAIQGAIVNFVVAPSGGGTLSAPSATTDASGHASVTLTLGHTAQLVTVAASVVGVTQTAAFSITAVADVPALIEKVSGDGQNAAAGAALANPLVVKVSDQYSNPVSGALVTFTVTLGGGSLTPTNGQVNTGSDGKAQVAWTVGTTIGANTLNAGVGALAPVTFSATANPPSNAKVVVASGSGQTAPVTTQLGNPLVVQVSTAGNVPIQGAVVNFAVNPAGRATLSSATGTTDANGQTQVTVTMGQVAGAITVTASVFGVAQTASFIETATAGAPANLAKVSGDNQTGLIGALLASPLVVKITDQYNNPVLGVTVNFAVTSGGGGLTPANGQAVTDSAGLARISWTLGPAPGANTASASYGTLTAVNFTAGAVTENPATLVIISGNNQTATVMTPVANPLVVEVRGASGAAIPFVNVSFAVVSGGASLSAAGVITNSLGRAQVTVTLGQTAGLVTVAASVSGLSAVNFSLTAVAGAAASIQSVSQVGSPLPIGSTVQIMVLVTDAFSNPVPNKAVNVQVTSGGGSAAPTATTNAFGVASAFWILGLTVGDNQLVASVTGIAATVTFRTTTASAQLTASPAAISETVFASSGVQLQRNLTLTASPNLPLPFTALAVPSDGGAWIRLSHQTGTVPFTLTVTLDSSGLTSGTYSATVMISSSSVANPLNIPVTFTVKAQPGAGLAVSPSRLDFTAVRGGSNPEAKNVFIVNSGLGTLAWTASVGGSPPPAWLSIDQNVGVAPSVLSAGVNSGSLASGTYQGTITVTSASGSQSVAVTLVVQDPPPAPDFLVSPATVVTETTAGSTQLLSRSVTVRSTGSAIAFTATVDPQATWLSVTSASGTTPAFLSIQVNPAGLSGGQYGQYAGTITLSAPGVTSRTINVVCNVAAAPELVVRPAVIRFAGAVGGAISSQNVQVKTASGEAVPYTIALELPSGRTWLSASPTSGSTPGNVTLSVNTAGLAAGTYAATLTATSPGTRNSAAAAVLLDLVAPGVRPVLNVSPGGLLLIARVGGSTVSRDVQVRGDTGTAFTWTSTAATLNGGNWLSATPAASSGDGALSIRANPTSLPVGVYLGQVKVFSPETVNPFTTVNVALLVVTGSVIPLSSSFEPAAAASGNLLVVADPADQFMATVGQPRKLEAYLVTTEGALVTTAEVTVTVSNETRPITLKYQGDALYAGTWTPEQAGSVALRFSAAGATDVLVGGSVASAPTPLPVLSHDGAVNGASFAAGLPVTAGSIVSIFGTDLAAAASNASGVPLPTSLGNSSITVNGIPAPLFYVSSTQINVQIPFELAGQTSASIRFLSGDRLALLTGVALAPVSPGIFLMGATTQGAIIHQDGRLADSTAPAAPSEWLSLYLTGLGEVTNPPATGARNPSGTLSLTKAQPTVTIGGVQAEVNFSGLAPGFVALYQVNAKVPAGVTGNSVPVVVLINGVASNTATIAVR